MQIKDSSGFQPLGKMEMMLIVFIGLYLILELKKNFYIDDGIVKALIEVYTSWAGYFLNRIKRWIDKYVLKK